MLLCRVERVSRCSLFTFDLLHNLRLGILKVVRKCMVNYLLSDGLRPGRARNGTKSFAIIQGRVRQSSNFLFNSIGSNGEL